VSLRAARPLAALAALLALALPPRWTLAGAQVEEPIDPAVLQSLTARISDTAVPYFAFDDPGDAHKWISAMSSRLRQRMPDRKQRIDLLKTVQYEATRAGLDPQLVLGVIEVESHFRKYAISRAGARGYMQVMPFWTRVFRRPRDDLFHLRVNLRYGCIILRYYLDLEKGDYFRALGRYNGSLGRPEYPNAVYAAWRGRWKYDGATS
jgi:soluble lytic murein transglycosylase-like protein